MSLLADFISIFGLALLGYGLFLFDERVSFCVVGIILMCAGYRIGGSAGVRATTIEVRHGPDE